MSSANQSNQDRHIGHLAVALDRRGASGRCPAPDEIVAWHEAALDKVRGAEVAAHVANCDVCNASWLGLLDSEAGPDPARTPAAGPTQSWWSRLLGARPLGAAVAAALLLAVGVIVVDFQDATPALPDYSLGFAGAASVRGDAPDSPTAEHRLRTGDAFELLLTPKQRTAVEIEMQVYAEHGGEVVALAMPTPRISASGAVLLEGQVGADVMLPAGESRLLVVVGVRDSLPPPTRLSRRLARDDYATAKTWQGWALRVTYRE